MPNDMTIAEVLQHGFNLLKGWKYCDLSPEQKKTLYIYLLWSDGAEEETAVDVGQHTESEIIDQQLRTTFGYSDVSVIA